MSGSDEKVSKRVSRLAQQLSVSSSCPRTSNGGLSPELTSSAAADSNSPSIPRNMHELIDMLENKLFEESRQSLVEKIPSTLMEGLSMRDSLSKFGQVMREGTVHIEWQRLSEKFGGDKGCNVFVPGVVQPKGKMPYVDALVALGNPEDANRIAHTHVKKSYFYDGTFLGNGVLATKDVDSWQEQRKHLSDAFLPRTNLTEIFPISRDRARFAVNERLPKLLNEDNEIEVNEFLLYEAMAQLQMALLGDSQENMDKNNVALRRAFKDAIIPPSSKDPDFADDENRLKIQLKEKREAREIIYNYDAEILKRGHENDGAGPVMRRLLDLCPAHGDQTKIQRDNASTFLFAGHDTTANLMTHFVYMMAVYPDWQSRIMKEVDAMFDKVESEKRLLQYEDLFMLNTMKHCINETLRLWPSVPNGTFRELQFDDYITNHLGEKVLLPAGTQLVIPPWLLHRNKSLWGPTVNDFNPNRDWLPEEDWFGKPLSGQNPASHRYCPFTFAPRDCMGRNFAQMEARVILSHFFRKYHVKLSPKSEGKSLFDISKNIGTLGPINGLFVVCTQRSL